MDHIEDSENNAKISDSGYSHSCSNQSRSHSSKSTHSRSNSSGSSGYGGKATSGDGQKSSSITNQSADKRKKEKCSKKKKASLIEIINNECNVDTSVPDNNQTFGNPQEKNDKAVAVESLVPTSQAEHEANNLDVSDSDKSDNVETTPISMCSNNVNTIVPSRLQPSNDTDGFSCVISMHDGVVMYATGSLTKVLGFPKDMWIGRSFIDFVHLRDRDALASLITNGLAVPKTANGMQKKASAASAIHPTMVCRIRRYRGLATGFGIKESSVLYMPFLIKLSFKNISEEKGYVTYLVLQTTPFFSAYTIPNEIVTKSTPFVIRHAANGNLEYIDPESVPYLGYLPQDVINKDALLLYHPEDLPYLKEVYETIVKEGHTPRCKSFRMLAQNGDYTKVETEWSSFINPWSKKLEFVIGKHYIIEGPNNPDVFLSPGTDGGIILTEQEEKVAELHRESILRILSEVLTKPAEVAKQKMTQRCQDLASFMEGLMEDVPKEEDELCMEIQDPDISYYERDSVMFGGISPHHEYDSRSSAETPLSYNQLNYNETLHRYFECHQHFGDGVLVGNEQNAFGRDNSSSLSGRMTSSPIWGFTTETPENEIPATSSPPDGTSSNEIMPVWDHPAYRLTEFLLHKHNSEMEKELLKKHREHRPCSKPHREKISNENYHKNKEHLVRVSESFMQAAQTSATATVTDDQVYSSPQPHAMKRPVKMLDTEGGTCKQHCSAFNRHLRRRAPFAAGIPNAPACTPGLSQQKPIWKPNNVSSMNTFIYGVGLTPQLPIMNPVPPVPVQCMMYGQTVYGSPLMYSSRTPSGSYNVQQPINAAPIPALHPLLLTNRNYEEACKSSMYMKPSKDSPTNISQHRKCYEPVGAPKSNQYSVTTSNASLKRVASGRVNERVKRLRPSSDETVDRTDESSYSSFYSSFFKTESGSADDSSDARKSGNHKKNARLGYFVPTPMKKVANRKLDPPWLEQVCVTPNLMYKYQIVNKSMNEVLSADKLRIKKLEQPTLVNEQLGQLYLDLHLEGVASRLTLEEGITSSSSSGEETSPKPLNKARRKRESSKLGLIYEEDAPLPPPISEKENEPSASTSKM